MGEKREDSQAATEARLRETAARLNLQNYQTHLFLCTGPKCCDPEVGAQLWDYLKAKCAETGVTPATMHRSRVQCLRICHDGPIAVLYPEGKWFHSVDRALCDSLIAGMLKDGQAPETNKNFANQKSRP